MMKKIPFYSRISYLLSLILISIAFLCCNKENSNMLKAPELSLPAQHHGYVYIACAAPPYYLSIDSLVNNAIPLDSFPSFLQDFGFPADSTSLYASIDTQAKQLGNSSEFDIAINYLSSSIEVESTWAGASTEAIPFEFNGTVYQAGEHPYLGGYRYTSPEIDLSIQVVNVYIGGCYHNVVVWEVEW